MKKFPVLSKIKSLNDSMTPQRISVTFNTNYINTSSGNTNVNAMKTGRTIMMFGFMRVTTAIPHSSGVIATSDFRPSNRVFGMCYQNAGSSYGIILDTDGTIRADDQDIPTGFKNIILIGVE